MKNKKADGHDEVIDDLLRTGMIDKDSDNRSDNELYARNMSGNNKQHNMSFYGAERSGKSRLWLSKLETRAVAYENLKWWQFKKRHKLQSEINYLVQSAVDQLRPEPKPTGRGTEAWISPQEPRQIGD